MLGGRNGWVVGVGIGCLAIGVVIGQLVRSLTIISALMHKPLSSYTPCFDVYNTPHMGGVYSTAVSSLLESDYGRPGLKHVTLLGGRHQGVRDIEVCVVYVYLWPVCVYITLPNACPPYTPRTP